MTENYLSDLQLNALKSNVQLIEAGPGSGKTRVVVERYRQVASRPGSFAALVSFTNSAVGEVRKRCATQPNLLQPPNFVGTFDAFFHRFVTTPSLLRAGRKQPQYVPSWDDLPDHWSRLRPPSGGAGIPLTAFEIATDGKYRIVEGRLSYLDSRTWKSMPSYAHAKLEDQAGTRHSALATAGIISADVARTYALDVLHSAEGDRILELLQRRFSELIVDEFQDCNETEIQLLTLLRDRGVPVIAVADPDQAIYQFRQEESSDVYQKFREGVPDIAIAPLNECHRSTQPICDVVTSLRNISADSVVASSIAPTGSPHVYVLEGSKDQVLEKANKVLQANDISPQASRILAHRTKDARSLVHHQPTLKGASSAKSILDAIFELRSRQATTHRLAALDTLGRVFVSAIDREDSKKLPSMADDLAALGIEMGSLRLFSKRLVDSSRLWEGPDDYASSLTSLITKGLAEFHLTPKPRLKTVYPKPNADLWAHWVRQVDGLFADHSLGWEWSNIHQVKGGEFDAVLLCVPAKAHPGSSHALDDWEQDVNSEQRRVLYVGASRAQRLLMFWPGASRQAQLLRIFERDGIPYLIT